MKNLIILITLLFSLSNIAYAECQNANVYDDINCYEKELKMNKTQLNQTYQKLYKSLDDEGKRVLENSQKSWLAYKNSHCDEVIAYFAYQSLGAGPRLITLGCNVELTKQRLVQLKELESE